MGIFLLIKTQFIKPGLSSLDRRPSFATPLYATPRHSTPLKNHQYVPTQMTLPQSSMLFHVGDLGLMMKDLRGVENNRTAINIRETTAFYRSVQGVGGDFAKNSPTGHVFTLHHFVVSNSHNRGFCSILYLSFQS